MKTDKKKLIKYFFYNNLIFKFYNLLILGYFLFYLSTYLEIIFNNNFLCNNMLYNNELLKDGHYLFMNDNVEEPTKSTDDYNRHGHSSSSSPDINSLSFRSSYININIDKRPLNIHFVDNFVDIEPNLNDNFRHVIVCDRTNEIDYGDGYGIREAKMIDVEKKIIYIKDEDFNGDNFYDMIVHWRFIPQLSDTELSNFNSRMWLEFVHHMWPPSLKGRVANPPFE